MLHLVDNHTLDGNNDKMLKIALLCDSLNESFVKYGFFHKCLSVDESMVPYLGHHSCKSWCLCGSDGYPYHFTVGENFSGTLGSRVVNERVDVIAEHSDPLEHELLFDNFFTSYNLLVDLAAKNFKVIGTVRENRTLGASNKMKSLKEMKKSDRGTLYFRSDDVVYFCKWNANSIVNIGSNFLSHLPIETVKRRVKREPDVRITHPQLIKQYNNGMGGVDVVDRILGFYRPVICGKKWYWPLIINAISVSVVAAWQLHCAVAETPKSHSEFRDEIAICLLKSPTDVRKKTTGGAIANLPSDLRYVQLATSKSLQYKVDAK